MTRVERLKKLMDEYYASPDDYDEECEEDVRPYFLPDDDPDHQKPDRWCCVTRGGENGKPYFLTMETKAHATSRATEYVRDNTFSEYPEAVVNLDTGIVYEADYNTIRWTKR